MTGNFPDGDIDHINRVRNDNRWSNLRECTQSQNSANTGVRVDNTSGYKGVVWLKKRYKWKAQIMVKQKQIYLGQYNDIKDAAIAYNIKAKELLGKFACLNEVRR